MRNDLNAVVIAAVIANAVRQHLLMALGAIHDRGQGQFPVGAAAALAGLRNFTFGESNDYTS